MKKIIAIPELHRAFTYDPSSGILRWKIKPRPNTDAGDEAGCLGGRGYRQVVLDGEKFLVHRVAWAMSHGSWPKDQIDHINMIRDDNRIANLREADSSENRLNSRAQRNNSHGSKGVAWDAQKQQWIARIMIRGKRIKLGRFLTREDAGSAYAMAAEKYAGEFARV